MPGLIVLDAATREEEQTEREEGSIRCACAFAELRWRQGIGKLLGEFESALHGHVIATDAINGNNLCDDEGDKHKLDESSFERFWSKAWNERLTFRKRGWASKTMKTRSSGGDEVVQDNWDTFSKDVNDIEYLHNPSGRCMFERLEFQDLPLSEEPSIYRELAIYDQLAADFSWRGVDRSIAWVEAMRQEDAVALHAMQVPVDGDPPPATPDEEVVEAGWGDDPEPDFSMAPVVRPPVVADEIKVVVFDLYGVILHTIDGLTRLYLEAEAHLIRDRPDVLGEQLVHAALRDMLCTVGLCLADDIIREKEWGFETMKPRSSGGDEAVQDNWDTFSKDVNDVEHLHDPFGRCVFERLEFKDLPLTEEPSIYRELAIYDQLAADYSWRGVKRSIYWVEAMRNFANEGSFVKHPVHPVDHAELCSGEPPSFSADLKEDAVALRAMQIPVDGDPPPASAVEEVVEAGWGDEPEPDFSSAPEALPPVVASEVKVIVFDLYGAIMDRQEALRRALSTFIPLDPHQHTVDDLSRLYLDVEAHRIREMPDTSDDDLVRGTLSDILHIIGLHPAGDMVQRALDAIRPAPYVDVPDALRTLQQRGYKLLCLVSCDASHVSETASFLPPEVRTLCVSTAHLHTPSEGVCSQVVEECQSIVPEIKNTEILLVTTGLYRIVELASAAGIPTALVQRPSVDEARLERATGQDELSSPTMTIGGLGELCDKLALMRSESLCHREPPLFSAAVKEDAVALHAMQVPVDGDPPPATPDEEVVEAGWGDDPEPDFSMAPVVRPPVVADEIKVVVFDLYGVILHTIDGLMRLYLEAEAHLIRDTPDLFGEQLVHAALRDMLCTVGLCLADDIIRCALDAIRPAPYADVPDALRTLQQRGYKLLCLVSCDASHVSDTGTFLPPEVPDLHTQTEGVCSQVAEECRSIVPEIKNTEILLVTTGLYRIVELANAAGIPTALVQRPSVDEAQLERKTEQGELSSPTMTVGGLGELCDKLDLMRSGSIG
ncbi:predicted protein [Postia placenta Mad-698-R]|nr:predicted protein [Postia placenta Mad-698-R]